MLGYCGGQLQLLERDKVRVQVQIAGAVNRGERQDILAQVALSFLENMRPRVGVDCRLSIAQ